MEFPQSLEQELELLLDPDVNKIISYISILIDKTIERFETTEITKKWINTLALDAIQTAKKRYLENESRNKGYKFSTYYSWYLQQILESNAKDIKEK